MPSMATSDNNNNNNGRLVEYIIVGEQSDAGQQALSLQFPSKFLRITDHPPLLRYILPSFCEGTPSGFTTFIINRGEDEDKKRTVVGNIYTYKSDEEGWKLAATEKKLVTLTSGKVQITSRDGAVITTITKNKKLEFIQLHPKFIATLADDGSVLGILFETEQGESGFIAHMKAMIAEVNEEIENETSNTTVQSDKRMLFGLSRFVFESGRKSLLSLAIFSVSPNFLHPLKPLLEVAVDSILKAGNDKLVREKAIKELYEKINNLNSLFAKSNPNLSMAQKRCLRRTADRIHDLAFFPKSAEIVQNYTKVQQPNSNFLRVPYQSRMVEVTSHSPLEELRSIDDLLDADTTNATFRSLLLKFGADFKYVYNAILLNKRVLFVSAPLSTSTEEGGPQLHPAEELSNTVLTAVSVVAPISGILNRSYPIANDVKAIRKNNFIAGAIVSEEDSASLEESWDVLADLRTCKITVNGLAKDLLTKASSLDSDLFERLHFLASSTTNSVSLLALIRENTERFLEMCYGQAELSSSDPHIKDDIEKNEMRISLFLKEYPTKDAHMAASIATGVLSLTSLGYARRLFYLKSRGVTDEASVKASLEGLKAGIKTDAEMEELFSRFSVSGERHSLVNSVASLLYHSNDSVKKLAASLLLHFHSLSPTFLKAINPFYYHTLTRLSSQLSLSVPTI